MAEKTPLLGEATRVPVADHSSKADGAVALKRKNGGLRLASLDGLRTLLTTLIIVHHSHARKHRTPLGVVMEAAYNAEQRHSAAAIMIIFFMLSGFVTTISGRPGFQGRARFIGQKAWRLAPVYLLTTVISLWAWIPGAGGSQVQSCQDGTTGSVLPLWPLLLTLVGLQSWFPLSNTTSPIIGYSCPEANGVVAVHFWPLEINGQVWYVSTLFGCLMIYALVGHGAVQFCQSAASRKSILASLLGSAVCLSVWICARDIPKDSADRTDAAVQFFNQYANFWPPFRGLLFFAGAYYGHFVHLLWKHTDNARRGMWFFAWLDLPFAGLGIALSIVVSIEPVYAATLLTFFSTCALFFLVTCEAKGLLVRFLAHPALSSLGGASYAAYCIQGSFGPLQAQTTSTSFGLLIFSCWFSGALIHYWVELPIARHTKHWCRNGARGP